MYLSLLFSRDIIQITVKIVWLHEIKYTHQTDHSIELHACMLRVVNQRNYIHHYDKQVLGDIRSASLQFQSVQNHVAVNNNS